MASDHASHRVRRVCRRDGAGFSRKAVGLLAWNGSGRHRIGCFSSSPSSHIFPNIGPSARVRYFPRRQPAANHLSRSLHPLYSSSKTTFSRPFTASLNSLANARLASCIPGARKASSGILTRRRGGERLTSNFSTGTSGKCM